MQFRSTGAGFQLKRADGKIISVARQFGTSELEFRGLCEVAYLDSDGGMIGEPEIIGAKRLPSTIVNFLTMD